MKQKLGIRTTLNSTSSKEVVKKEANVLLSKLRAIPGKHLYNIRYQKGFLNDDFIHNEVTLVLTAFWYKKPRFIK